MPLIACVDDPGLPQGALAAALGSDVALQAYASAQLALQELALQALQGTAPDLVIAGDDPARFDAASFTRDLVAIAGCHDVPVLLAAAAEDPSTIAARAWRLLWARAQATAAAAAHALGQVIDAVPVLLSACDADGHLVMVNSLFARVAGTHPAALSGMRMADTFGEAYENRHLPLDGLVLRTGNALPGFEEEITDRNGTSRILLTTKAPYRQDGRACVLTTSLDITERRRAEARLAQLASHDALTGLPNRVLLRSRLARRLEMPRARSSSAVLFIDLDFFKLANDQIGHENGDLLLLEVARRLEQAVAPGDLVARLAGDEFAILQSIPLPAGGADLALQTESGRSTGLAQQVLQLIETPFQCGEEAVHITCSIGIALHPQDGMTADELLRSAELAMHGAKADGRSCWRLCVPNLSEQADQAARLRTDLREALERGEFVVHYQPQVALATGHIAGVEALLRWNRPGVGLLRPGEFLQGALEAGLTDAIDRWVLQQACQDAADWQAAGLPRIRLGINLSPRILDSGQALDLVTETLAMTGLDATLLELELTEGDLVENLEAAAAMLGSLRQLGVAIAIDDFGMGYSSLNYVKSFPVDRLKIDQSFVRDLETEGQDATIVHAIIALGHSLGLSIVAEGVETVGQLTLLMGDGCDEIQGYYFSEPLPRDELEQILKREQALSGPLSIPAVSA
nr:EAL domain-containing protein [uncultured Lichenicoccus sp.]